MNMLHVFTVCLITVIQIDISTSKYASYNSKNITAPSLPKMPNSCKNDNNESQELCFSNEGYPQRDVDEVLKDITTLEIAPYDYGTAASCCGHRQGDPSLESDCRSNSTNDLIYFIIDQSNKERVVVQKEKKFEQRISITKCEEEGRLNHGTQHFTNITVKNNDIHCETKYTNFEFLVINLIPGNVTLERVRPKSGVPICCACVHKKKA